MIYAYIINNKDLSRMTINHETKTHHIGDPLAFMGGPGNANLNTARWVWFSECDTVPPVSKGPYFKLHVCHIVSTYKIKN